MTHVKYNCVFIFHHVGAALPIGIKAEIAIPRMSGTFVPREVWCIKDVYSYLYMGRSSDVRLKVPHITPSLVEAHLTIWMFYNQRLGWM